jgi:hypothetical protein
VKIYVSATYGDLQKHREAVSVVLRRMGHQVIGMEEYVAEGVRPLHRCLEDVRNSNAYVGILGWRYGHIPASTGAQDVLLPEGSSLGETSITEFEFRQAVQCKKSVLMFLLDPEAEWPSTQFDAVSGEGDHGAAIARFRQEIGERYMVSYFRSPEELASFVSAAVYRVEMDMQMKLESSLHIESRLNEPFVRKGPVQDSTLMEIKNVIAGPQEIQALLINIGQGLEWWMTRLYILSSLAADLTAIEVMIFVSHEDVFVGVTNPTIVKERLAQNHSSLRKYESALRKGRSPSSDLMGEVDRRLAVWNREMSQTGGEDVDPVLVTKASLERWLAPYLITQAVEWTPTDNASVRVQRLIDWPMRFVPVVEEGRFARVVDKQALTEQVARAFVREQVSRALSMIR